MQDMRDVNRWERQGVKWYRDPAKSKGGETMPRRNRKVKRSKKTGRFVKA